MGRLRNEGMTAHTASTSRRDLLGLCIVIDRITGLARLQDIPVHLENPVNPVTALTAGSRALRSHFRPHPSQLAHGPTKAVLEFHAREKPAVRIRVTTSPSKYRRRNDVYLPRDTCPRSPVPGRLPNRQPVNNQRPRL